MIAYIVDEKLWKEQNDVVARKFGVFWGQSFGLELLEQRCSTRSAGYTSVRRCAPERH